MDANHIMLFGGIVLTVAAVIAAVVFFFIFKMKREKINSQMDKEYGEIS